MNNLDKNKEEIWIGIFGLLIFLVLPLSISKYLLLVPALCILSIYFYSREMHGRSISILFFIILCTPCFQIQGVDWQITRRISYLLYLTIGVLLCFQRKYGASDLKIFNPLIYLSIGVVFTEFCYYAFDVNKSDFALRHSIFRIFEFFLFFLLIYRSRLQFEQLFYILCIGFIGTSVYVFLETFLDFTPYKLAAAGQDNLYSNVEMYQVRAKGLFMHPLILSAFTVIFYTVLLIRTIIMNKPAVFMLILCICTGIFSMSRTTILLFLIGFILFLYFSKVYRSVLSLITMFIFLLSLWFIANIYLDEFIIGNILRFQQVDNQGHRFAAYETGWNVFSENFLGIGVEDLMSKIASGRYNAAGLWTSFGTLDNFFITHVVSYGILSVLHFSFFYFYLYKSFKSRRRRNLYFKSILFLYLMVSFIGLSFDLEFYTLILICWAAISAVLLKSQFGCGGQQLTIKLKYS